MALLILCMRKEIKNMLKSMLFKTDKLVQGDPWIARLYSNKYSVCGRSIAFARDGSVYVCGYILSSYNKYHDIFLAKFNESGSLQWQKKFEYRTGQSYGSSVAVAPDSSVYFCGCVYTDSNTFYDLFLAKFNESGSLQWKKSFDRGSNEYGYSVAVARDGSVYVCGCTGNYAFLAKFNESGSLQWQKKFRRESSSSNMQHYALVVAVARDGSVYVCGKTGYKNATSSDGFLAKFNESGSLQWQKLLTGRTFESCESVAVARDGSVYVCGYTMFNNYTAFIAKFNESGSLQWQKVIKSSDIDLDNYSVAVAPDGSVYVCGFMFNISASYSQTFLVKINDSIIEKSTATFGIFTIEDTNNITYTDVTLTNENSELIECANKLSLKPSSNSLQNSSFNTILYTES